MADALARHQEHGVENRRAGRRTKSSVDMTLAIGCARSGCASATLSSMSRKVKMPIGCAASFTTTIEPMRSRAMFSSTSRMGVSGVQLTGARPATPESGPSTRWSIPGPRCAWNTRNDCSKSPATFCAQWTRNFGCSPLEAHELLRRKYEAAGRLLGDVVRRHLPLREQRRRREEVAGRERQVAARLARRALDCDRAAHDHEKLRRLACTQDRRARCVLDDGSARCDTLERVHAEHVERCVALQEAGDVLVLLDRAMRVRSGRSGQGVRAVHEDMAFWSLLA